MSSHLPSKPLYSHGQTPNGDFSFFGRTLFSKVNWPWPSPFCINLIFAALFALAFGASLVLIKPVLTAGVLALLGLWTAICLALCLGLAWLYQQCFNHKKQQTEDLALLQSLDQTMVVTTDTRAAAVLYQGYTEHLKLGRVANLMLSQDTQSSLHTLQTLNKQHAAIQETSIQQQQTLDNLAQCCAQHIQNTKNTLNSCAKGLHDHADIQKHLQACRHQLGQFNQFAFECKQTMAVLHRHTHKHQEQTSPAIQHQQQQLLKQLEHMQEHTQHMLQHMHQAQVGLNALEKQHTDLHMALQQQHEDALRAEKASVVLKIGHSQWEEHLKQSQLALQQTITTLRQTETLAASLGSKIQGKAT